MAEQGTSQGFDHAPAGDYADAIVETVRDPMLVLDAELRVKLANRAFYQTFKVPPEKPVGRLIYELGDGQWNIPALRKLLDELLPTNGHFGDYLVEHDFPDIGRRTMLLNARRLHNGDNTTKLILLAIEDITERRQAEYQLEVSEVRYRRLFEAAHDGILILNTQTRRITDVNPFILDLLDYPREYFVGKELWEIGIFRDKDENQSAMQELHDKGSIRYENMPLQDRNGRRHPVEIVANIYQEDHQPVIQCNIRDIAERVRFERERAALLANEQASRMEAEAANRAKDVFLATLSHEMRTPLNAILGWAVLLRREKCTDADLAEGLQVIERNARAQAQLIEDVLDVSRIVSGKLRLDIRRCDLVAVIAAALDAVRAAAEAKNIELTSLIDPSAAEMSCDPTRIQQVVWNLVANAIKFTPRGGQVIVRLAREHSNAVIDVSDSGQGIAPEFLSHVFERFRQADDGTTRRFGGLGLGLSIVKHLVELHGGTVEVSSEGEGKGATFVVKLPIRAVHAPTGEWHANEPRFDKKSARAAALNVAPVPSVSLDGLRILVVDDEPDARRLVAKALEAVGATVTLAESGAEALALLPKVHPHVLVSDLGMPVMDGYDLIWAIRSAGHTAKELPAVALTAFAHKEHQRRALLAGFQVHVSKPVDPHDLLVVVASVAGRTGTR